jgi:hypothetical protein
MLSIFLIIDHFASFKQINQAADIILCTLDAFGVAGLLDSP